MSVEKFVEKYFMKNALSSSLILENNLINFKLNYNKKMMEDLQGGEDDNSFP